MVNFMYPQQERSNGCGSKIDTQNGTLVNRNMDQSLRSKSWWLNCDPYPNPPIRGKLRMSNGMTQKKKPSLVSFEGVNPTSRFIPQHPDSVIPCPTSTRKHRTGLHETLPWLNLLLKYPTNQIPFPWPLAISKLFLCPFNGPRILRSLRLVRLASLREARHWALFELCGGVSCGVLDPKLFASAAPLRQALKPHAQAAMSGGRAGGDERGGKGGGRLWGDWGGVGGT